VLTRFKQRRTSADHACMTTPSDAPAGRFRRAAIVPSSPQEQVRQLLADGPRMYALYEELLRDAGQAGDGRLVLELAAVAREADDPHRAYAAQRLAVALLLAMSQAHPRQEIAARMLPLKQALQLLVPVLEQDPHEPELLHQLGQLALELGDVALARRIHRVVLELEPEHDGAGRALAGLEEARGTRSAMSTEAAATLEPLRARLDVVLQRAVLLEDRTISLCMIVRDEEEMLAECLASVAPFVDQLVVVDTGSVDSTIEIARGYGATVVEFEWTGSFSDARNESLRHATGDWILWLDADERLVVEDGPRLRELARRSWVEGFHVVETHLLGDGTEGTASHAPMRMFRRRPEYSWRGVVHEQVAWALPGWLPGRVQHTTIRVDHYGYMTQVVQERDKSVRNLKLLHAQHETDPSAFTSFNIGSEHASLGDWAEAHAWFERSLAEVRAQQEHWQSQPWSPLLVLRAAVARRMCRDHAGAVALAQEGLAAWPDYSDLVWEQARSHADCGDWEQAQRRASHAVELGDAPARYVAVSGKGSFQARHLRAQALRQLGRIDEARSELEAALESAPRYQPALADLAELLLAGSDDVERVEAQLDAVLGSRCDAATPNLVIGACLHEAGHLDEADARYRRVLEVRPKDSSALVARAEIALAQHGFEEAWQLGMQVDELDRLAAAGAQSAFLAAAALGRAELVAAPATRIEQAATLAATERAVYVAWRQLLAPGDGVRALIPSDSLARDVLVRNLYALARMHATDAFELLHDGLAAAVMPDAYERGMQLAQLYLRLSFPDMAGSELMTLAERFGPDAAILTALAKVATIKQMWDDAEVLLSESLQLDPAQPEAERLLDAVQDRQRA
jgi:tetratricopeptide (TPR) repeat protein